MVGLVVPMGFILAAQAVGWARLQVSLSAGTAGTPFYSQPLPISAAFHSLADFLTARAALALAQNAAWDFTLIVILGPGAEGSSSSPTIFRTHLPSTANRMASGYHFTPVAFWTVLIMEVVGFCLILGWVRWRDNCMRLGA